MYRLIVVSFARTVCRKASIAAARRSHLGTQKQCRRRCSAGAPPAHRPRALDARRTNRHSRQRCAALLSNLASGPSYKLRVREFAGIPISRNRICSLSANSCSRCASAMTPALRASREEPQGTVADAVNRKIAFQMQRFPSRNLTEHQG
jgi:hypothetical protein